MKSIRQLLTCFVAVSLAASLFAQDVGLLHLKPLHLELPPTWRFDGAKTPIEGFGPDGEKLLITIARRRADAAADATSSAKTYAQGFASAQMRQLAEKGGKSVLRQVSEIPTRPGKVAFSAGSEIMGFFGGKSYFVQYMLADENAMIYLTFEGKGDATAAMQKFDAFIATQKWDD